MTLLNAQTPTLRAEDNFKLTYHGTYSETTFDKETNSIGIELKDGPLPKGRFLYDGEDVLGGMEPGQSKLVSFNIIRVYFGDPRSLPGTGQRTEDAKGRVGDIPPREHETRRLATTYGLYDTNAGLLAEAVPKVTILTADDIEVICPATDPDGEHIYGAVNQAGSEVHDPATRFAQLEAELKQMRAMMEAQEKRGGKNDGADVAHDSPPKRA